MADKRVCSIPGCGKKHNSHGLCSSHGHRLARHGDPLAGGPPRIPSPPECNVKGCCKKPAGQGYCLAHYKRFKKHGDPLAGRAFNGQPQTWLLEHVKHQGEGCLIFPFAKDSNGYGTVEWDGKGDRAHRIMCLLVHGEPPSPEYEVAHTCGRGSDACCHPSHVRWSTPSGNQMDRVTHGTSNRGVRNAAAKLSESDVMKIRSLKGTPRKQMARIFNVSRQTIDDIINRKRWSWLKD